MTSPKKRLFLLFVVFLGAVLLVVSGADAAPKAKPVPVDHREAAKIVTHSVAVGLGGILANVKGDEQRINVIRAFIDPVRFFPDNSGYFYVYDSKCVNIAHATQKDLQGKNLYDYKDAKGKLVIQALLAAAKKGGGFVDFYWVKPGTKEQMPKLGYVEPIPGTDYFIGTGVYLP